MNQYHILNGDALKERFPKEEISGELIVARECMISGPVNAKSEKELFEMRAAFIAEEFGEANYEEQVKAEFTRIKEVGEGSFNLWFEEDLFCQTNLWFICSLLYNKHASQVHLILPPEPNQYSFGHLSQDELKEAHLNKRKLSPINVNQFALLWFAYRSDDIERLLKLGVQMHAEFPFVMRAIEAHFDRLPKDGTEGKPAQIIRSIMEEYSTEDFRTIFPAFCKRAPIYGFGDLQVKKLLDKILQEEAKTG